MKDRGVIWTSRARRERHRRVPADLEHKKGNGFANGFAETRATQQNKNHSKASIIAVKKIVETYGTLGVRLNDQGLAHLKKISKIHSRLA